MTDQLTAKIDLLEVPMILLVNAVALAKVLDIGLGELRFKLDSEPDAQQEAMYGRVQDVWMALNEAIQQNRSANAKS